jgi:EAL domain-containing protein (putative c-di-GMP-specific phosphodiesterase class I)
MTAFCRVAGLEVVAEHISDREILAKAKEGGARYFQGYLFSKPLSAEVILGKGFAFPEGCQSGPVPLRPAAAVAGSERT